jgi:protein-disulfide isomerase
MHMKKLYILLGLTLTLTSCKLGGGATDEQIKAWIEKNPEVIAKSLTDYQRKLEEENNPKDEDVVKNAAGLFEHKGSPTVGPADAPIKIAYFFDFQCGHCRRQSETNAAVLAKRKDVQIIYKNLAVLGPASDLAARAALAAGLQGKYFEFYKAVNESKEFGEELFKKVARNLKLDMAKWEADRKGEEVNKEMIHVTELAESMKIRGTPAMAISPANKIFPGRVDRLLDLIGQLEVKK